MNREEIIKMEAGKEMVCKKCGSMRRMMLKTGYTQCLDCHNERNCIWNRENNNPRKWNKTPTAKVYRRKWQLNNRYGMTLEEYEELNNKQGGKCAICGNMTDIDLCVDHDHKTNKVRGLLCNKCNVGLANFRDNPELLLAASSYLEKCK